MAWNTSLLCFPKIGNNELATKGRLESLLKNRLTVLVAYYFPGRLYAWDRVQLRS